MFANLWWSLKSSLPAMLFTAAAVLAVGIGVWKGGVYLHDIKVSAHAKHHAEVGLQSALDAGSEHHAENLAARRNIEAEQMQRLANQNTRLQLQLNEILENAKATAPAPVPDGCPDTRATELQRLQQVLQALEDRVRSTKEH